MTAPARGKRVKRGEQKPSTRWGRIARLRVLVWIAGCAFFAVFLSRTHVAGAIPLLLRLPPGTAAAVVAANAAIPLLKLLRWHALLDACGVRVARRRLLVPVSAGFFWGLVTPGTSGEMGRGFLLDIPPRVGMATVAYEKVYDSLALLALALAAVVARVLLGAGSGIVAAASAAAVAGLALLALPWVAARLTAGRDPARATGEGLRGRLLRGILLTRDLAHVPRLAVLSALVSLLLWLTTGVQFVLLVRALGAARFPWTGMGIGFFVPYIAGVASLVPLGLGVLELGVTGLLGRYYGVGAVTAHATALAFRLSVTLPFVLWGFACYSWQAAAARRRTAKR